MSKEKISLEKIKEIQLEILKYIKGICEEHNIKYFLCGGTLLGAVRHKGFIPWDDDIDILLPRNDYMRLISLLKDGDKYRCLSSYYNSDYYYSFAKVVDTDTVLIEREEYPIKDLGVFIDIFPIDGLPENKKELKTQFNRVLKYRNRLYFSLMVKCLPASVKWKYGFKYMYWFLMKIIGWKRWLKIIERLGTMYKYADSDKVACIVSGYGLKEIMNKSVFEKVIFLEFEGEKFPAPIGYNEYLTSLYGDYMKLPPIEKRVSHHKFEAFFKNHCNKSI